MDGFELVKQGAEAKLYRGTYLGKSTIIKERFVKSYRQPQLDTFLTKERMRAECRAIVRCKSAGVLTPTIYLADLQRRMIFMEHFDHSVTVRDFIRKADKTQLVEVATAVGVELAKMHCSGVVHGDPTSSNMLLVNVKGEDKFDEVSDVRVAFIDFGLACIEATAEDKGVDLYVLERALLSTHMVAEELFSHILGAYKAHHKSCKEAVHKYEEVKARGRKRTMVG